MGGQETGPGAAGTPGREREEALRMPAYEHILTPRDLPCLDMRYPAPVRFMGRLFPSAENAYQASRFSDPRMIDKFQRMTPDTAAFSGEAFRTTVDNWERSRRKMLDRVLESKFSDPAMKRILLSTGTAGLSLSNFRHENDLGICKCFRCRGRGNDIGGQALTALRDRLIQHEK